MGSSLCRLYLTLCRRFGPGGLTLSAYAWKRRSAWVRIIDAGAVLIRLEYHHCREQFMRETRETTQKAP